MLNVGVKPVLPLIYELKAQFIVSFLAHLFAQPHVSRDDGIGPFFRSASHFFAQSRTGFDNVNHLGFIPLVCNDDTISRTIRNLKKALVKFLSEGSIVLCCGQHDVGLSCFSI